jgi:hypothetical protein
MAKHRYNLIRFDTGTAGTSYKLFVRSLYDYVIVKEVTTSDVTERSYFVAAKDLETNWSNRASLTYSIDIRGRKLVNEGQNWLAAAGRTFTGLLDEYGGTLVAYSLRLLNSSYSGDAVTVRRASDNATLDIGFVDNALDTSSLESFCAGTDGFVTVWYDQNGGGENAFITTASAQPQIVSSGSVLTSFGKPAVYFDGVNDILDTNITDSTYKQMFVVKDSVVGNTVVALSGAVQLLTNQYNTSDDDVTFSDYLGLYTIDNENTKAYLDGVDETGGATVFTQTFNRLRLGSITTTTGFSEGYISEVILYTTDQAANRTAIESNINDYYNIF